MLARVNEGPSIAKVAALLAEPSRATMLSALMSGQALTATELADSAGIGRSAASEHLARLLDAGFLQVASQGRHRYFRIAGEGVAEMLERILGIAQAAGAVPLLRGPRDRALRQARVCYDHLAGELAVALHDRLLARGAIAHEAGALVPGPAWTDVLRPLGLALQPATRSHSARPLCRSCLDWSARRDHVAGALGAALLSHAFAQRWASRETGSRVVRFTAAGAANLNAIAA